jgi:hypothetical protein
MKFTEVSSYQLLQLLYNKGKVRNISKSGGPFHVVKESQEYTLVVAFQTMQIMEKSGICLSCGVPAHEVRKVRNMPELWRSSP